MTEKGDLAIDFRLANENSRTFGSIPGARESNVRAKHEPNWRSDMSLALPNQMEIVRALLISLEIKRAGDRDRTGMASLEGWGSTIELHPRSQRFNWLGFRLSHYFY